MSKMIQVRNVPDEIHKHLRAKALQVNKTLSDYLLDELRKVAELPSPEELFDRIRSHGKSPLSHSSESLVRAERQKR